ncbi:MAG TPA: hypothetical protein VL971_09965 [Rhizomicrobium sp.]|nr:hypothetical protein [Rhizomicrobium sp.]
MFRLFPLLIIPVIIYNLFALGGGVIGHYDIQDLLSIKHSVSIHMFSGDYWNFSFGDLLVLVSLLLLFVEVVKATRTTANEIINHALSMLVFVIALIEFITLKGFATSPFFFIMVMTLFDVVAGYTISIVAAEHDLGLGRAGTD